MLNNRQFETERMGEPDAPDLAEEMRHVDPDLEQRARKQRALQKHNERQGVYEPGPGDPF